MTLLHGMQAKAPRALNVVKLLTHNAATMTMP